MEQVNPRRSDVPGQSDVPGRSDIPVPGRSDFPVPGRSDFPVLRPLTTRWADNDAYGHVNNVVYYAYFDTVVNTFLIERGALDIEKSPVIGLVVENGCQYFSALTYPETVTAGLRVAHLGRSSVRYE